MPPIHMISHHFHSFSNFLDGHKLWHNRFGASPSNCQDRSLPCSLRQRPQETGVTGQVSLFRFLLVINGTRQVYSILMYIDYSLHFFTIYIYIFVYQFIYLNIYIYLLNKSKEVPGILLDRSLRQMLLMQNAWRNAMRFGARCEKGLTGARITHPTNRQLSSVRRC